MRAIYLQHRTHGGWYRIACDVDTRYYLFDDACEPVGLTAELKTEWKRITKKVYDTRPRRVNSYPVDETERYFSDLMLTRVSGLPNILKGSVTMPTVSGRLIAMKSVNKERKE